MCHFLGGFASSTPTQGLVWPNLAMEKKERGRTKAETHPKEGAHNAWGSFLVTIEPQLLTLMASLCQPLTLIHSVPLSLRGRSCPAQLPRAIRGLGAACA